MAYHGLNMRILWLTMSILVPSCDLSGELYLIGDRHLGGLSQGEATLETGGDGFGVLNIPMGTGRLRSTASGLGLAGVCRMK